MTRLGKLALRWMTQNPWTNVYGLARSLLAGSTALTLLVNHSSVLFRPAAGIDSWPICEGLSGISLFCLCGVNRLELARWIAIAVLLLTATGWRPRVTSVAHWWITFSLQASAITLDGGDQVAADLALFLIPVGLTDDRRWHWERSHGRRGCEGRERQRLIALSALLVTRVQVAGIYFHSAVGKFRVEEWADGTALYYWFTDPSFGAPAWLAPLIRPLLANGTALTLLTWGSMAVELALFMALVIPKRAWAPLLMIGIAFHAGIAVVHGLTSFSIVMIAALILYLRPPEKEFTLLGVRGEVGETKPLAAAEAAPS